jgi:hypothetical protein
LNTLGGLPDLAPTEEAPATHLLVPSAALVHMRLVAAHAAAFGLAPIGGQVPWVLARGVPQNWLGTAYTLVATMPYKPDELKGWLNNRSIGKANVRARNFFLDPPLLLKRLGLKAGGTHHIFLAKDAQNRPWVWVALPA